MMDDTSKKTGLERLREPFHESKINHLPKPTVSLEDWKKLPKAACKICGAYHATTKTIHLSYVGHAALTDRLLECDISWGWTPFATDAGLPLFDKDGGLWINLTVCGVTRPGYGNAQKKQWGDPGAREKEVIGDALRNAAMRFGAALDLWHKGDLHGPDPGPSDDTSNGKAEPTEEEILAQFKADIGACTNDSNLKDLWIKTYKLHKGVVSDDTFGKMEIMKDEAKEYFASQK